MILDAILIGICAYVYSFILLEEGMILGWFGKLLCRLPDWLHEPLGGCEYCVAGQMALWYYLWVNFDNYLINIDKSVISHILFITLAIFVVELINIWKQK